MRVPMFGIFSGYFGDKNAKWIEAVEGLGNAADRMKQLAAEKPGSYFVYSIEERMALAAIDSSAQQQSGARQAG
jgi:hypothetical protein